MALPSIPSLTLPKPPTRKYDPMAKYRKYYVKPVGVRKVGDKKFMHNTMYEWTGNYWKCLDVSKRTFTVVRRIKGREEQIKVLEEQLDLKPGSGMGYKALTEAVAAGGMEEWRKAKAAARPIPRVRVPTITPDVIEAEGDFEVIAGEAIRDKATGKIIGYIGAKNQLMDIHGTVIGSYVGDRKTVTSVSLATLKAVPEREGIPYCEAKNYEKAKKYLVDLMEKGEVPGGSTLVQRHNEWVYIPPKPENETMKLDTGEWINKQAYDRLGKDFPDAQKYLNEYGFKNYNERFVPAQQWVTTEVQTALKSISPYKIEQEVPKGITTPAFVKYIQDLPVGYDLPTAINEGIVSDKDIRMLFGDEALAGAKKRAKLYAIEVPGLTPYPEGTGKFLSIGKPQEWFVKEAPEAPYWGGSFAGGRIIEPEVGILVRNQKDFEEKWKPFIEMQDGEAVWLGSETQLNQYVNETGILQQQAAGLSLAGGMLLSAVVSPLEFLKASSPVYGTYHTWGSLTRKGQTASIGGDILWLLPAVGWAVKAVRFPVVKVPIKGGTITVWRGMSIGGKPTFGISQSKLTIGARGVKYPRLTAIEAGYEPVTRIETSIMATRSALRKMKVSEPEINKLLKTLEERARFAGKESQYLTKEAMFDATRTLNSKSVMAILREVINRSDEIDQVYGSTTTRAQLLPKLRGWRKPADIDMQTRMTPEATAAFAQELVKKLKITQGAKNVRISKDRPTMIEIKVKGKWHHGVDIHFKGEVAGSEGVIASGSYGMLDAEPALSIDYPGMGTLRIMRLSEAGKRKAREILRWFEGKFKPYEHRTKDIADFYVILWTFEGEARANAWAKVWGYTPSKLLAVAEQNPPQLVAWHLTPSKAVVPKGASPSVRIVLPSELADALKTISPGVYRSIIRSVPYTSSLNLIPMIKSLSVSIVSKKPSKISTSVSASLPSSPAISPSIKISPSISPSLSPSGKPSPIPSPAPYPYGYPYPYPAPVPIPKVAVVPKKPKPLRLPRKKVSQLTKKQREGIIAWKQGWCYRLIYPPFGIKDMINSRKPLAGVKYFSGVGAAYRSVIARGGKVPREVLRDMGIMDLRFRSDRPTTRKPRLFYKRDIKQKTATTPGITRMR